MTNVYNNTNNSSLLLNNNTSPFLYLISRAVTDSISSSYYYNQQQHQSNFTSSWSTVTATFVSDDASLVRYKNWYRNYHGYFSAIVCLFGLTCNLFNIIVLTRPSMRSTTNTILTSLAISDLLKMLFVLPAAILFYCIPSKLDEKSEPDFTNYFQVHFYMIQMLFTLTLHCISTWLTVLLAAFRHIFLTCKTLTAYVSTPGRALAGVICIVIFCTILCVPSFIEHEIVADTGEKLTIFNRTSIQIKPITYKFIETEFSSKLSLRDTVFVLHAIVFKLIPCILLLFFSFLLIRQLRQALKKAEIVSKHSQHSSTITTIRAKRGRRREKENRRTTLMLVIVCVLFLVTELPQGAILFLSFISENKSKYYYQIYQLLGDTFDILALINNSVNFILYCSMSRAFRDTFRQTFFLWKQSDQHETKIPVVVQSTPINRQLSCVVRTPAFGIGNNKSEYEPVKQICDTDYRFSIFTASTALGGSDKHVVATISNDSDGHDKKIIKKIDSSTPLSQHSSSYH